MVEQYEKATWRHLDVGDKLLKSNDLDDAGYHFGVSGENAVKAMLQISGVEAAWKAAGGSVYNTPMRSHFPALQQLVASATAHITTYATGRMAGAVLAHVTAPSFAQRFPGWNINIRYADTAYTPVSAASCNQWQVDAEELALLLLT